MKKKKTQQQNGSSGRKSNVSLVIEFRTFKEIPPFCTSADWVSVCLSVSRFVSLSCPSVGVCVGILFAIIPGTGHEYTVSCNYTVKGLLSNSD